MAETAVVAPNTSTVKKTKKVSSGVKKPKSKPTHPPVKELVVAALKALKERKGSSLLAIKKFIKFNSKLDTDKLSPFIKRFLKKAVADGTLVQTKGKGASGSFKLPVEKAEKKAKSPKKSVKKLVAKKPKKTLVKKAKSATTKSAKKTLKPKQKPTKPKSTTVKRLRTPKPKKTVKKVVPKKK